MKTKTASSFILIAAFLSFALLGTNFSPAFSQSPPAPKLVYVIVASNIYNNPPDNTRTALSQWKWDVESGLEYSVEIVVWYDLGQSLASATYLRDYLRNAYETRHLSGALFVGDIPFVKAMFTTGIGKSDFFFRSLYSEWEDYDFDGIFDSHKSKPSLIWVSRLKASPLVQHPGDIHEEIALINNYFAKNHAYRINDHSNPITSVSRRGLALSNSGYGVDGQESLQVLYNEVAALTNEQTTEANIKQYLSPNSGGYETLTIGAHGGVLFHNFAFNLPQIFAFNPKVIFTHFSAACGATDFNWISAGQAYVFAPVFGLVSTGSALPGSGPSGPDYFNLIKMNFTVADATIDYETLYNFSGEPTAILGDPLLKFPSQTWSGLNPPIPPAITGGPSGEGLLRISYDFNFGPLGENGLAIIIDWGDGTSSIYSGLSAGSIITKQHMYTNLGKYVVRYRTKKSDGALSGWSENLFVEIANSQNPVATIDASELTMSVQEGRNPDAKKLYLSNSGNYRLDFTVTDSLMGLSENIEPSSTGWVTSLQYHENNFFKDNNNNLYMFFEDGYGDVYYAKRNSDLTWEPSEKLLSPGLLNNAEGLAAAMGLNNAIYVFKGTTSGTAYRTFNTSSNSWQPPLNSSPNLIQSQVEPRLSVTDSSGVVHLLGKRAYSNSNNFTSTVNLFASDWEGKLNFLGDSIDNIHLIYITTYGTNKGLFHNIRYNSTQNWRGTIRIDPEAGQNTALWISTVADSDGFLYMVSLKPDRSLNMQIWDYGVQAWSAPQIITYLDSAVFGGEYLDQSQNYNLLIDNQDNIYLLFRRINEITGGQAIYYSKYLKFDNLWTEPAMLTNIFTSYYYLFDTNNVLNLAAVSSNINMNKADISVGSWLSLGLNSGTVNPGGEVQIPVNFQVSQLKKGEYKWHIIVNGVNDYQDQYFVPVKLTVYSSVPARPAYAKTVNGGTFIDIYWPPVTQTEDGHQLMDLAGYKIYRGFEGSGVFSQIAQVNNSQLTYRDSSTVAGQRYSFRVIAIGQSGKESLPSDALPMICGDADGSGSTNVSDLTRISGYLFQNGVQPYPVFMGDVTGDGTVNVADVTYMSEYLYRGGAAPKQECYLNSIGSVKSAVKVIPLNQVLSK
jgi:hypothetical protein